MHIVYDNIIFNLQKAGGISTYWKELSIRLLAEEKNILFLDKPSFNVSRGAFDIPSRNIIKDKSFLQILNRFRELHIKEMERKFIFHSSYNRVTSNVNALNVVTVHDFVHEKFYSGIRRFLHSYQKSKSIQNADRIITVSQNTKNDLIEFFPSIDPDIIKVIYNGVSTDFYFDITEKFVLLDGKPFILFIGSREHYKNFQFMVDLLVELPNFNFCIVGSKLNPNEVNNLNGKIEGRWVHYENIDNVFLNKIYNNAHSLIYPSSYEGFGIPLLEAMRAGCPFIALNKSSIPEVAGNAGVLLPKLDIFEFKKAVLNINDNRENLRILGFSQVEKFSWEKCYQETMEVYKELLD